MHSASGVYAPDDLARGCLTCLTCLTCLVA